jgi:hypothetical protein
MSLDKESPNPTTDTLPNGIVSSRLTHCDISRDGKAIRLSLLDQGGNPAFVEFALDEAASIIMTLPRLLTAALQSRSGSTDLRYVFLVNKWSLEIARGQRALILTLRTEDGFDVSFGLSLEMCMDIGSAIMERLTDSIKNASPGSKTH